MGERRGDRLLPRRRPARSGHLDTACLWIRPDTKAPATHYPDLSPCTYSERETIGYDWGWLIYQPDYARLNVGWLDAPATFPIGPTPGWFADALLDVISQSRVTVMRGFHRCTTSTAHSDQPPADFVDAVRAYDPSWATEPSPRIPAGAERETLE